MEKINQKKWVAFLGIGITIFMFALNCLTKYAADDYCYHYNLADGTAVTDLVDVFRALYDHYIVHSGRVFAHFFVYIFLLMPKFVFNIVCSIIFVIQIYLIYKLAKVKNKKDNVIIFLLIFAMIWCFESTFGQVNLWLTGACNYLFGITLALGFFYSFAIRLFEEKKNSVVEIIGWCIYSFVLGGYSENISFSVIWGALLVVLWNKVFRKGKIGVLPILKILFAFGGYVFMLFAPSTIEHQAGNYSISEYMANFKFVAYRFYSEHMVPLYIWAVVLVIAIYAKVDIRKIFLSCICTIISLCSACMLFVATYTSDRSFAGSLVFLVMGIAILLFSLWDTNYQVSVAALSGCIILMTSILLVVGIYDITWTYRKTARQEAYLKECAAKGQKEVVVDIIDADSKYSASYRLPELDSEDPTAYPNSDYEKYFGIESILSREKSDEAE